VTREDQECINTFSRLNSKAHDLGAHITAKKVRRGRGGGGKRRQPPPAITREGSSLIAPPVPPQAEAEDLEEAGNEVMLLDDETVPYLVGECFVHLPREEVEERLQARECRGGQGQPDHPLPPPLHVGLGPLCLETSGVAVHHAPRG
jgi:hypothetical protein